MKDARYFTGKRTIKFLAILVGVVFLILAAFTVSAQQTNEAQFRVKNENAFNINLIQFKRVEYVGVCPGNAITPDSQSARFVSSKTPPGPNRRVMIKNVTDGMETNPYPYTDRGYKKNDQVIEQGALTAEVSIQSLGTFPRQQICQDKIECQDTSDCRDRKGRKRSCRQECFPVQQC